MARRFGDAGADGQIVDRLGSIEPIFGSSMWLPGTLSNGLAGTALMYSLLARSDPRCLQLTHRHLRAALESTTWGSQGGLMGGSTGALVTARGVSGVGKNYPGLREKLTTQLAATQTEAVRMYTEALKDGVHWLACDIMHRMTGMLRVPVDEPSKDARNAAEATNGYLCSHILEQCGSGLLGQWMPSELKPIVEDYETYSHGDLSLGTIYGVIGVAATLTMLAERASLTPEMEDALRRTVDWVAMWRQEVDSVPY